ncbi:MAG TPA: hypothetical protein VHK69_06480 [Chitinophagaceae bacterium]|nr:hypothetical protein [Chitinophagaceae bacterium]
MKAIIRNTSLVLTLTLGFVSCTKETLHVEETPKAVPAALPGEASIVQSPAKTYRLLRHGGDSLAYYNDGRLASSGHKKYRFVTYNYGFNTIIAKSYYYGNAKPSQEDTYSLEVSSGRAYQVVQKRFFSDGTADVRTYKFQYDALGRLVKRYNASKPVDRIDYEYDAAGDLVSTWHYGEQGQYGHRMIYFYRFGTEAKIQNRVKLNHSQAGVELYLDIFGTGWKNAPKFYRTLANGKIFKDVNCTYKLNADGFPITRTLTDITDPQHPKSPVVYHYGYQIL